MREIKFRAWGPNLKHMWEWDQIKYVSLMDLTLVGEKIVMQFTGLQDKNGTDIYEGDVVKIAWSGRICQVVFHKYTAGFDLDYISDPDPGKICCGWGPAKWKHHVEVIGNIYENPELLK